jgi:Mrp family chromosome partitioning ATPase
VKLKELQREANANRAIYEQFLERYNATNQQRLLQASQTKVASFATPPTRPTRPPLLVLIAAIAVASILVSIAITAIWASMSNQQERADNSGPPEGATAPVPVEAAAPPVEDKKPAADYASLPIVARLPDLSGVRTLGGKLAMLGGERRLDPYVVGLLDAIGVKSSQHGKVVLVTSVDPGAGKSSVARALNAIAVDRGMLSVVIEVAGQSRAAPSNRAEPDGGALVRVLKTTIPSVVRLIAAASDVTVQNDVRSEFDLILIDAPALASQPEVAEIAAHTELNLLVIDSAVTDAGAAVEAQALLSRSGHAPAGVVVNKASAQPAPAAATIAARLAS